MKQEKMPECPHKGEFIEMHNFCKCNHPDKMPGLRLCVKKETCPLEVKDETER